MSGHFGKMTTKTEVVRDNTVDAMRQHRLMQNREQGVEFSKPVALRSGLWLSLITMLYEFNVA